ncbi:hypothetical protein J8K85_20645, partial [Bacteroides fragilis]|uniref:hypothetical protein n=1 Tax=Bacteroides fragilis TaxID=817 RepID=UPI00202E51F6
DGKDYKTDKGRKLSFMRGIFISCWINHKKRKKLEGTLFGHPHLFAVCSIHKTVDTYLFPLLHPPTNIT